MRITSLLLLLLASANVAAANTSVSTSHKAIIGINAAEIGQRVCFYQDMAYSSGAIIQVGEHFLICQNENNFETNGALKWASLPSETETSSEPSSSKTVKRISQLPN